MTMQLQFQNKGLYALVLLGSSFLFLAALGPGLFNKSFAPFLSWQFDVFHLLCHQDPARSFSINSTQMAVCARCIGIYFFFLFGVIIMPLTALIKKARFRTYFQFFIAAIILNFVDVLGNLFGIWTNTNTSRVILGSLFGLSAAILLTNEFFKKLKTEVSHGK